MYLLLLILKGPSIRHSLCGMSPYPCAGQDYYLSREQNREKENKHWIFPPVSFSSLFLSPPPNFSPIFIFALRASQLKCTPTYLSI